MEIIKNLVPESKYSIKCPYDMKPTRIVVHNTANDATARNEVAYMIRNNNQVSFHYAVDDKEIVQGVPENRNTWNAADGNGKGNREGISIEICYSKSGGARFIAAEKLAAKFIAQELKKYGWGIDKVTKHQDYNGKYCPHRTLDMGWQRFLNMVKEELYPTPVNSSVMFKKNDLVKLSGDATYYNGKPVPAWVKNTNWYVKADSIGDRVVIDKSEDEKNNINSPVNVKYVSLVAKKNTATTTTATVTKPTTTTTTKPTTTKPTTTQTTTTVKKPDVIYQVYAGGKWWGEIKNYNEVNSSGYAGVLGKEISGIRVKLSNGKKVTVMSHVSGNARNNWLSPVTKWDNTGNGYSGWKGKPTDCIAMKADGHTLKYRVHVKGGNWLGWVSKCDIKDYNSGLAGAYGKPIDAVQIMVV